jgi:hypothetical protein
VVCGKPFAVRARLRASVVNNPNANDEENVTRRNEDARSTPCSFVSSSLRVTSIRSSDTWSLGSAENLEGQKGDTTEPIPVADGPSPDLVLKIFFADFVSLRLCAIRIAQRRKETKSAKRKRGTRRKCNDKTIRRQKPLSARKGARRATKKKFPNLPFVVLSAPFVHFVDF